MRPILKALFLLALPVFLIAETQVSISTSATMATIGEQIDLKIRVKTTERIDNIKVSAEKPEFETVQEEEVKKSTEGAETVFEKHIVIAFFKTGDFEVSPFTVDLLESGQVKDSRKTNSLSITIESVLSKEDKDIKPLRDPIALRGNPFYVLKYVLIFLAMALVSAFIFYRLRKKDGKAVLESQPLLPPLAEFEAAVDRLWAQRLWEKGRVKEFFLGLTQASKRFLNRTYGFNAEDLTTDETMARLLIKEKELLIIDHLGQVFLLADLVKFARLVPDARSLDDIQARIRSLVSLYKQGEEATENLP